MLYIKHHGIKGQRWGVRRFQNEDGSLTEEGRKRYNDEYEDIKEEVRKEEQLNIYDGTKSSNAGTFNKLGSVENALNYNYDYSLLIDSNEYIDMPDEVYNQLSKESKAIIDNAKKIQQEEGRPENGYQSLFDDREASTKLFEEHRQIWQKIVDKQNKDFKNKIKKDPDYLKRRLFELDGKKWEYKDKTDAYNKKIQEDRASSEAKTRKVGGALITAAFLSVIGGMAAASLWALKDPSNNIK